MPIPFEMQMMYSVLQGYFFYNRYLCIFKAQGKTLFEMVTLIAMTGLHCERKKDKTLGVFSLFRILIEWIRSGIGVSS